MKIKELLTINLDDEIRTVVDLDASPTETALKEDLDNFVLTNSLAKHLHEFLEEFNSGSMQSGVWLSGFYGSGKSYFAQIIGMLLSNPTILGTPMRDRFSIKLNGLENEGLVRNEIGQLSRYNNVVVSFDASKHNNENGLPFMTFSSLLRHLGMAESWHGIIEYDLYIDGKYDQFLAKVQEQQGQPWSEVSTSNLKISKAFKEAILALGYTKEEFEAIAEDAKNTKKEYDASKLKTDLKRFIDLNPDSRIVFFIDEMSEAITQKKIRLDDLEGVAEALADLGRKVWTIAIAQQRLDDVIKAENIAINSLTKVRDRFRSKIAIEADEVDTIIRHRLLDKPESSKRILRDYFAENNGTIADVTNIRGVGLRKTDNAETYVDYYPFFEHQFKLLQYFLFGSRELVQTRVGNRGMIISAFDVLKKEVKNEVADHFHVNATQLCNQADDKVEESLRNRYRQAEAALQNKNFTFITGDKLLRTIHFLTKSEVTPTTAENIAKSYLNRPENYHDILTESKKALDILIRNQIVILTNEQYRITNEAEQHLLDEMRRYEVQQFEITYEANKILKVRDFIKACSLLNIDGMNIRYRVTSTDGEEFANNDEQHLTVVLDDIFSSKGSQDTTAIDDIRQRTADEAGKMTIVPTLAYRDQIRALVTELKQLDYISSRSNQTDQEKQIVHTLCSDMEHKKNLLQEIVEKSYLEGVAIYAFNKYTLAADTYRNIVNNLQTKMFENIFTKRLSSELSDSLASGVFSKQPGQLATYFGTSLDFKFFDTAGVFIGTGLSVVTEILAKATSFISGKDLEKALAGPPTGYKLGTIMSTIAALFRGDKLIVKFNGDEYTSWRAAGATEAFRNSRTFEKASFKAVSQSLTYNERRDLIDILKEDCKFKKLTRKDLSYQLNDFDIINALRDLSIEMISRINHKIEEEDYADKFRGSIAAKSVFQQYQGTVTEGNLLITAHTFLNENNTEDYIKAIERVLKDIDFIENKMRQVRDMQEYISEVTEQFDKATGSTDSIKAAVDHVKQCIDNDIRANYTTIEQETQNIRDKYHEVFTNLAAKAKQRYSTILTDVQALLDKLNSYPREWNQALIAQAESIKRTATPYTNISDNFETFSVKSNRSRLDLRDVANAIELADTYATKLMVIGTQIITVAPAPPTPPTPPTPNTGGTDDPMPPTPPTPPTPPAPVTRHLKSQLPQGNISVDSYRNWLTQQLQALNSFASTDLINLND
jgi:hypothetical protein